MRPPRSLVLDGKAYLWSDLLQLHRQQLQALRTAEQLALFDLRKDRRPATEHTGTGRYQEPTLFTLLES